LEGILRAYVLDLDEVGFSTYRKLGLLTIQVTRRLLECCFMRYSIDGSISRHCIKLILVRYSYHQGKGLVACQGFERSLYSSPTFLYYVSYIPTRGMYLLTYSTACHRMFVVGKSIIRNGNFDHSLLSTNIWST
jgi:hypothetical protein